MDITTDAAPTGGSTFWETRLIDQAVPFKKAERFSETSENMNHIEPNWKDIRYY